MIPGLDMGKMLKLAPLAAKKLTDLTLEDISGVVSMFGIEVSVTEELQAAALGLLQGKDIHTVADMIQSPESVTMMVEFIRKGLSPTYDQPLDIETSYVDLTPPTQLMTAPPGWRLV